VTRCLLFYLKYISVIVYTIVTTQFHRNYFYSDLQKSIFWSWIQSYWICVFMANIEVMYFIKFGYQSCNLFILFFHLQNIFNSSSKVICFLIDREFQEMFDVRSIKSFEVLEVVQSNTTFGNRTSPSHFYWYGVFGFNLFWVKL
jgi:hypothetical protein